MIDEDAGVVDDTTDPEALARAYAREACDRARRCASINAASSDVFCHEGYRSPVWEAMRAAWSAGRADFDAEAARACLDAITGETCGLSGLEPPPAECFDAIVGNVEDGGECGLGSVGRWSAECRPGLVCRTDAACPGHCEMGGEDGTPCSVTRPCAAGLICSGGACLSRQGLGEPCGDTLFCDTAAQDLVCFGGECRALGGIGDPCEDGLPCRPSLRCATGTDGTGRCEAWLGTGLGEPCRRLLSECDHPLVCARSAAPSDPDTSDVCTRGVGFGESCDELTPCGPGGRCVEGACAEIAAPGGPCDGARVCPTTHECVAGTCAPLPATGESCEGACAFDACVAGVCESRWPGDGEACGTRGYACEAGSHCGDEGAGPVCRSACS
ncbi:MAG: hypothetical protein KC619_33550 [Myxococcales bacterium]|nr:hypothetical protein [Myxococcales bacterium]